MILVDTSIWVDHLRARDRHLQHLLNADLVITHPMIIGEIAMGSLRERSLILYSLESLPTSAIAKDAEVLQFVSVNKLFGLGIGYIDAHLIVAALVTQNAKFWTRDKRLARIAETHRIQYVPS